MHQAKKRPPTTQIDSRYNGPPASANGGYACGMLGTLLDDVAEVTLRSPPPLDTPLSLVELAEGWDAYHQETLIAQVRPGTIDIDIPKPVSIELATEASRGYPAYSGHPFPSCIVMSPCPGGIH